MAKRKIQASIELEDAKFKNSIKNINSSLKLVSQQFKEGQSHIKTYGATQENLAKTQDACRSKIELLKKQQEGYLKLIEQEQKALNSNVKERDSLNKKIEEQKKKVEDTKKVYGESSKEVEKEEKALNKLTKELISSEKSIANNNASIDRYNTQLSKAQTEINKTEGELRQLSGEFNSVGASSTQLNQTMKSFNVNNIVDGIKNVTSSLSATFDKINTKIIGFGKSAMQVGVQFSQSMANFQAVSGATAEEIAKVEAKAKELGGSTKYSASQASDAFGYMALAGFKVEDSLYAVEKVLKLATVAQMDLATASDMYTDTLSALGLQIEDTDHYMNILAQTQSKSNTTVQMMMEAYLEAGGQFNKFNTSLEESATLIGLLANNGIKGSVAGNNLNSILINLNGSTEKVAKAYKQMGIEVYDSQGAFIGYEAVLRKLSEKMGTMTEEQKTMWETVLGGKTQAQSLFILLDSMGSGAYDKLKASISECNGALDKQNEILNNTPEAKIAGLKSQFEALQLKVFDKLYPVMEKAMEGVSKFLDKLNNLDDETVDTILNLAKFSLITGVVLKGVNLLAGGVGNIVSLMVNFKALTAGTTVASMAMGTAVAGAGTATATAGASLAGLGSIVTGLGGVLAKVATFMAGPWGLAIMGGVAVATVAIKEGTKSQIEHIDMFADASVKMSQTVTDAYGETYEVYKKQSIEFSETTKNNVGTYMELTQNLENALVSHSVKVTTMTEEEKARLTELEQKFSEGVLTEKDELYKLELEKLRQKQADEETYIEEAQNNITNATTEYYNGTIALLEEQRDKEIATIRDKMLLTGQITEEEFLNQSTIIAEGYQEQIDMLNYHKEDTIKELERMKEERGFLTSAEIQGIIMKREQEYASTIGLLSTTIDEALILTERYGANREALTEEQMGKEIASAEEKKQGLIETAQNEYKELVGIYEKQRDITGTLTAEQCEEAINNARKQRNTQIETAFEGKEQTLKTLEELNKGVFDKMDKQTGKTEKAWKGWLKNIQEALGISQKDNEDNATAFINNIDKVESEWRKIPAYDVKTLKVQTVQETIIKNSNLANQFKNGKTYRMIQQENFNINDNSNYRMLEETVTVLTERVQKAISTIPDTFNNLIDNIDIVNQNNVFVDKKQIIKEVNRGIEEERNALEISKGKNRIIIR